MTWFFYALASAVLWGLSYALYEQLVKTISAASAMLYTGLGGFAIYALWASFNKSLLPDWQVIRAGGFELKTILALIFINSLANLLMIFSLQQKNATLAGMIEITYPLFTALFAWVLFRQMQFTAGAVLGFLLIASGIACIYFFEKPA